MTRRTVPDDEEQLVTQVRERYGSIARGAQSGCCSSGSLSDAEERMARQIGYDDEDLEAVPDAANLGLGCGAPVQQLELEPGETVLDLGSGGGLDCFLAAHRVGSGGKVIGIDMTPEMIERANDNAARAGLDQVEFRHGRLEALPVDDASVDAVTSNCVINLVPDKAVVFREVARVLRPGGRLVISDIVLDGELPEALQQDLLAYVGCVAGAMQRETYFGHLREAGLGEVTVLRDEDFLDTVKDAVPGEIAELSCRTGIAPEAVRGKVRSITFRARKS